MSVAGKTGSKPLAFVTALMVLLALAIPFVGSALANHGAAANPATVNFTGEGDSAPANTCNEITLTANGAGGTTAAEGETIDIAVTMSDTDLTQDLAIGFCDPDGAQGTSSNLAGAQTNFQGANQGGQTESGQNPICDVDDTNDDQNNGTYSDANFGSLSPNAVPGVSGCTLRSNTASTGTEFPAVIHDECFTDNAGQCSFGITSNQEGTANVIAWFDNDQGEVVTPGGNVANTSSSDYTPDATDPRDNFVKTWTTGGTTQATTVNCTPPTDSNPEGTRHEFRCTATNSAGQPVTGATITFDVTSGPNAEEIGPTDCAGNTNQQGQTNAPATEDPAGEGQPTGSTSGACGYNDVITQQSPLGTDTITAYINNATPQSGQPVPTTGPDAGEPQTTIQKTWVGPGRVIDCEPETATNQIGTTHVVTCTVRDRAGAPVQNVEVTFSNRGGPGSFTGPVTSFTNAQGQVTVTQGTTATFDPEGTTTIRGTITGQRGDNTPAGQTTAQNECLRAAGDPIGSTAGVCFDDVTKTWTRQGPPTTPPPTTPPPVEEVRHGRGVQITGFDHVKIPGKRSTGLIVKGRVTTDSGFEGCSNAVPVKVQIRLGGEWITRKTDTTNNNGVFKVLIRDVKAKYRAVATKHQIDDEDNSRLHICQRASDVRRHRHGG